MRSSQSASLYLRIRSANGGWVYARSVTTSNGRLRPLHALVNGKSVHCAEGNLARVVAKELPALQRAIEVYRGKVVTRLAMKLMALTPLVRI